MSRAIGSIALYSALVVPFFRLVLDFHRLCILELDFGSEEMELSVCYM